MKSDDDSLSWPEKFDLLLDHCVRYGEALIVLLLTVLILFWVSYQTIWILWSCADREMRLAQSLKMINDNWKVGLIILIPLFYRAIRSFLERVEEFAGIKAKTKSPDPTKMSKGE